MAKIADLVSTVMGWRPVRVFLHYAESRGPLMASGLAFQAIFAVFAALWVSFSVAGLLISANPDIQQAFFNLLGSSVPGLIDTGDGDGAIDPRELLESNVLGWTGAIALVGLLVTALNWLASARDAVRVIFGLPAEKLNFVLLKLKDIGLGLGFGVALLVSSALLVASTQLSGWVLELIGVDDESLLATIAGSSIGLLLMFVLDAGVLAALYRALSGLTIPLRRLLVGSLLGAAGLGVLKVLGSALLGGATRNPLLASFAVIIGLLIWFNLICQVVLLSASWIAVGMADHELIADPRIEREREEQEQLARQQEAARREEAARRLEQLKRERRWGWLRKAFRRDSPRPGDGGPR